MRYYFLALGALMVVSTGCANMHGGSSVLETNEYVNPPAAMLQRPGPMVDGPGPGVVGMLASQDHILAVPHQSSQVKFTGQPAMIIGWKVGDGWADDQLFSGNRYDFRQSAVYQLKFSGFSAPGYEDLHLYPTLEVRSAHPSTHSYLEHSIVPVEITDEDLEHVVHNNMVTKVIYLPDPENQARAISGVETLISTRLAPGVDPVHQAEQLGTIMVILRFGNKNLEMPSARLAQDGSIRPVSHTVYSGSSGQHLPPTPIATIPADAQGVPPTMIAAGGGMPGAAIMPIAGMGPTPAWGMPMTGTPIGLPGPPHLPYGAPAGLQQHVIRNRSKNRIPEPNDFLLIDVKHDPPINIPKPVEHVQYEETHPTYAPGEVAHPMFKAPGISGY